MFLFLRTVKNTFPHFSRELCTTCTFWLTIQKKSCQLLRYLLTSQTIYHNTILIGICLLAVITAFVMLWSSQAPATHHIHLVIYFRIISKVTSPIHFRITLNVVEWNNISDCFHAYMHQSSYFEMQHFKFKLKILGEIFTGV